MPIIAMLSLVLLLVSVDAHGDIYRYMNEEGVECFTDAPTRRSAVKVLKETVPRNSRSRLNSPGTHHPVGHRSQEREELSDAGHPIGTLSLPVRGRVSSPVGFRHDPIDGVVRDHKGVDIAIPSGTPVQPVAPGIVSFSGYRPGYGNTVIVRHDDGMTTLYAHNQTNIKSEGDPVDRGSTIAFSGSTGRTTGPHLHFEAWKDNVNITATFVPGAASPGDPGREKDGIRRVVEADGTLLFTNLP